MYALFRKRENASELGRGGHFMSVGEMKEGSMNDDNDDTRAFGEIDIYKIGKTGMFKKDSKSTVNVSSRPRAMDSNGNYDDPTWVYQQTLNYAKVDTQAAINQVQAYFQNNPYIKNIQSVYNTIPDQYKANWLTSWVLFTSYATNPLNDSYREAHMMAVSDSNCGPYCNVNGVGPGSITNISFSK